MRLRTKVLVSSAAAVAAVGAGAAIAAGQLGDPKQENRAVIDDAARQLDVTPSALTKALQDALVHRIDAAVAAGRLTQSEGDAAKKRIESGELPLFIGAPPPPGHFGGFHGMDVAALYLGLSEPELRTRLEGGKSLADVAKEQGKTADGLVQALVDDAQKQFDQAVTEGRLSKEDEQKVLEDLKQRIAAFVNGAFPRGFAPPGPKFRGRGLRPGRPFFRRRLYLG